MGAEVSQGMARECMGMTLNEAGQTARSGIDALRGSPALLVLVFLQVSTLFAFYLVSQSTQVRNQEREMNILNRCFPPSHHRGNTE